MQGYGHDQNFPAGKKRLQVFHGLGQHASQNIGRGPNLVVFEQMNQLTQAALIASVGSGFDVWRFQTAA